MKSAAPSPLTSPSTRHSLVTRLVWNARSWPAEAGPLPENPAEPMKVKP
jgi:hypothetical protein